MPAAKKVYPDWVQAYRTTGMTVKMKGDSYYLYKRTSRRVPGKKYPQPVDTYVGIITPEGVVKTNRKRVTLTDIEVYEYGYSRAVWELCPESWKKPLAVYVGLTSITSVIFPKSASRLTNVPELPARLG